MTTNTIRPNQGEAGWGIGTWLALGLAIGLGMLVGVVALWRWLPGLVASVTGPEPKAFWYLSRSSAFAAYGLLWVSMVTGLLLTNRLARLWPGGPTAFDLHQSASLLGLALALFHGLILLGDGYLSYTPRQILVPFASTPYRWFWVGLGQVAFYGLVLVSLSFYLRRWLGPRAWRWVHALSFGTFLLALAHGVLSGTDPAAWFYWSTGGSALFLSIYRSLLTLSRPRPRTTISSLTGGSGPQKEYAAVKPPIAPIGR